MKAVRRLIALCLMLCMIIGSGNAVVLASENKAEKIQVSTMTQTRNATSVKSSYTIKFNGNGATSGKMSALKNRKYGTSYKLKANAFKRKGYIFTGWNTKKDGSGKSYKNKANVKNLSNRNGATVTLYAQWKKIKYNIVFNGNGATSGKTSPLKNRKYGTSYKLTANAYKKKGYTFAGWNTKKDGSGKTYKNKASVKNLSSKNGATIKLYAQWRPVAQKAIWFMRDLYITQVPGGDFSHAGTQNFDVIGANGHRDIFAPFDCVVKAILTGKDYMNTVVIESIDKVYYADGTYDYMSMAFVHDNDISDLYVGKKIKQNEVFYQTGDYGRATGVHCHVCCIRGKYQNDYWTKTVYGSSCSPYAIAPTSALFVPATTNVIETKGLQFVRLK